MRSRIVRWRRGIRWLTMKDKIESEVQSEATPHILRIGKGKDAAGRRRHILPPELPDDDADLESDDDGSHGARTDQDSSA